jgi:hypothetical protein
MTVIAAILWMLGCVLAELLVGAGYVLMLPGRVVVYLAQGILNRLGGVK